MVEGQNQAGLVDSRGWTIACKGQAVRRFDIAKPLRAGNNDPFSICGLTQLVCRERPALQQRLVKCLRFDHRDGATQEKDQASNEKKTPSLTCQEDNATAPPYADRELLFWISQTASRRPRQRLKPEC